MTGGCTGANEKSLKRAGIPYRKIYLHPPNHARYYPERTNAYKGYVHPDEGNRWARKWSDITALIKPLMFWQQPCGQA